MKSAFTLWISRNLVRPWNCLINCTLGRCEKLFFNERLLFFGDWGSWICGIRGKKIFLFLKFFKSITNSKKKADSPLLVENKILFIQGVSYWTLQKYFWITSIKKHQRPKNWCHIFTDTRTFWYIVSMFQQVSCNFHTWVELWCSNFENMQNQRLYKCQYFFANISATKAGIFMKFLT